MFRLSPLFFVLLLPYHAFAQTGYELITPIGSLSGSVTLQQYLAGIFQTIIGIAGILAVLMLVICGIKLMGTGSVSAKSEAKQCIWNAIFGLLLAVGAWILLNTINPLLLKNDAELAAQAPTGTTAQPATGNDPQPTEPGWYFRYKKPDGRIVNSIRIDSSEACIQLKDIQNSEAPGSVQKDAQGQECFEIRAPSAVPTGSETSARNAICGNDSCVSNSNTNIFINAAPCAKVGSTRCTNVAGLPNSAISALQTLQSACGCKVTVSGGTEWWLHASHKANQPIFDIRKTTAVNNVIKSADPSSKRASFSGYYAWLYNNFWWTEEGDHWHACQVGTNSTYCRPK